MRPAYVAESVERDPSRYRLRRRGLTRTGAQHDDAAGRGGIRRWSGPAWTDTAARTVGRRVPYGTCRKAQRRSVSWRHREIDKSWDDVRLRREGSRGPAASRDPDVIRRA